MYKLVFVTSGYPPFRGYHCHRSLLTLKDIFDITVISFRALGPNKLVKKYYNVDGISVVQIPFPIVPGYNKNIKLVKFGSYLTFPLIKEILDSATILEGGAIYTSGMVLKKWVEISGRKDVPLICDAIGDDVKVDLPKLKAEERNKLVNWFDCILCNSKDMSEQIRRLCDRTPLILEAYRGVDFEMFHPEVEPKGPFLGRPYPRFLYLGGFPLIINRNSAKDVKGGIYLLEAWKIFERIPGSGHLIIGGPNSDCQFVKDWKDSLLNPERVAIVGKLKAEEVPNYIKGVDVVVIPSLSEGLPNLANESQACGTPVLGTDAGGIPETVENFNSGLIVKRESVGELLNGLLWFSSKNWDEIKKMGGYCHQRIKNLFPWSRYRDTALKGYSYALRKKGIRIDF